jgi:hypothetical protein
MILYETNKVILEFDSLIPCVIWTPLDFMVGDEFRKPFEVGMDFLLGKIDEMPNLGWLNDTRKMNSVRVEDVQWLEKNVNERTKAKKVAFVLPENNVFARMSLRFYIRFTNASHTKPFEMKAFEKLPHAKLWLKGTNMSTNIIKEVELDSLLAKKSKKEE